MPEKFSKRTVANAGRVICARNPEPTLEVREAFLLAHRWRLAHQAPMREVRNEMSRLAQRVTKGSLTAGRLKRFQSIRRKMRRIPLTLYQMQDIAGCRAIVPGMQAVEELAARYLAGASQHEIVRSCDDYIERPKVGGYRSRHLVVKFDGAEEVSGGNRLTIELQIRTKAQHGWATAVEAVGLVRREELKAGEGDPRWLRFFELMSSEIAADEGRPCVPNTPECPRERRQEIDHLNRELEVLKTLESYRVAIQETERYRQLAGQSYVIFFNRATMTVSVRTAASFTSWSGLRYDEETMAEDADIVRVEVDRVADLKAAYPNYFLDVSEFAERVEAIVTPTSPPRPRLARDAHSPKYDLGWWFGQKRRGA